MARLIATFLMSVDGFVAGPDVSHENPMGTGGERLHDWLFNDATDIDRAMAREMSGSVGAVILGRRTFDIGKAHWDGTPYPAPSFVLTSRPEDDLVTATGTFHFVSDGIDAALSKAKPAAGDKDVVVMGASVARQYLKAGLVDRIVLQIAPILLGGGARIFDGVGHAGLKRTRLVETPSVTHIEFVPA